MAAPQGPNLTEDRQVLERTADTRYCMAARRPFPATEERMKQGRRSYRQRPRKLRRARVRATDVARHALVWVSAARDVSFVHAATARASLTLRPLYLTSSEAWTYLPSVFYLLSSCVNSHRPQCQRTARHARHARWEQWRGKTDYRLRRCEGNQEGAREEHREHVSCVMRSLRSFVSSLSGTAESAFFEARVFAEVKYYAR